jgi:hypothetical protein
LHDAFMVVKRASEDSIAGSSAMEMELLKFM